MRVVAARVVRARRHPRGPRDVTAQSLRAALRLSAAPADGVEHVYVEARPDVLLVVLFVLPGGICAVTSGCAQLVRRTLDALEPGTSWSVLVADRTDVLAP